MKNGKQLTQKDELIVKPEIINDHPIEDVFGLEILSGDVYYKFGEDIVNESNLQTYLIEKHNIECYRAAN